MLFYFIYFISDMRNLLTCPFSCSSSKLTVSCGLFYHVSVHSQKPDTCILMFSCVTLSLMHSFYIFYEFTFNNKVEQVKNI